jgi:hypothetical protein
VSGFCDFAACTDYLVELVSEQQWTGFLSVFRIVEGVYPISHSDFSFNNHQGIKDSFIEEYFRTCVSRFLPPNKLYRIGNVLNNVIISYTMTISREPETNQSFYR